MTSQTGYNCANLDQHFGLGDAAVADSIVIAWPSGRREAWAFVAADRFLALAEGTGTVGVEPFAPELALRLAAPVPNPCRRTAALRFTIPAAGHARLEVFDVHGRRVAVALDGALAAGEHEVQVELPQRAGPGVYLCRLEALGRSSTVRLARVR